jgi:hypothetical protein
MSLSNERKIMLETIEYPIDSIPMTCGKPILNRDSVDICIVYPHNEKLLVGKSVDII